MLSRLLRSAVERARRTLRRPAPTFEPEWERILQRGFEHWTLLSPDELDRMRHLVALFFHGRRWEAARGMDLTDDVKVLISAQASMLLLGLDLDEYADVTSVIVHRSTVRLHGSRPTGGGTWSSGTQHLAGQAHHKGPVVLSWAAARSGAIAPQRGMNVVYHEFAHRLDMLDGITDGTPPLGSEEAARQWRDVCTAAFDRVREGDSILRDYAGTNPAEFFAVSTELFFNRPIDLRAHESALYRELQGFYGQDPAARYPDALTLTSPA